VIFILATALAALFGGAASSAAPSAVNRSIQTGYSWPVKPFDRPHPVRALVGDPRTVFRRGHDDDPLSGPGTFSFHNGVDIDAPSGTAVYPVVSGVVRWIKPGSARGVLVEAEDGRLFSYLHIEPVVREGQVVTERRTLLGRVRNWADELHFSEFTADKRIVNPLLRGHLIPYGDRTRPTVAAVLFRDARGTSLHPFDVHGRIAIVADAYDTPGPLGSGTNRLFRPTTFARDRFPVTPAALYWSLERLGGRVVLPRRRVVDFRLEVPSNQSFWRIYARGTYQNRAPIVDRYHQQMPGRYLFWLTSSLLDTRGLSDGIYVVAVTAVDAHGNRSSLGQRMEVRNRARLPAHVRSGGA